MNLDYRPTRILIWGKTYPELSTRHRETVCTGGCMEDGTPVRLYPVDFRYLVGEGQYRLYDWIDIPIARSTRDPRPESYKVRADQISIGEHVGTSDGWAARRTTIFRDRSWHYGCLEELRAKQKTERRSLGVVPVGSIDKVELVKRAAPDKQEHLRKLDGLQSSGDLFGVDARDLAYIPFRVRLYWHCAGGSSCPGHSASILDWGLLELGRREGAEKALQKLRELTNLDRYDLHLFMGNLFTRQHTFSCIGLWYPLRAGARGQAELPFN
jgi:hypothetical protein